MPRKKFGAVWHIRDHSGQSYSCPNSRVHGEGHTMEITLGRNAVALARQVAGGGTFHDRDLRTALGMDRTALARAWAALEAAGALTVTPAPMGRPRKDQPGRTVTVHQDCWVWAAVRQGVPA